MTARTWRDNWQGVRDGPLTLESLRLGLIWALCHVHTPVSQAEGEFASYVWDGKLPEGTMLPKLKERGIESVNAYVMGLDWDWWTGLESPDKLLDVIRHVWGLGAPKASFALTSAGFTDIACLDTHITSLRLGCPTGQARTSLLSSWDTNRNPLLGLSRYLSSVVDAYGCIEGSGVQQWADYEELSEDFKADGHAVFFAALGVG